MNVSELRRECAERRGVYHHAKTMYGEAVRRGFSAWTDMTALRSELEEALVAYYAAHSALHSALARPAPVSLRLH